MVSIINAKKSIQTKLGLANCTYINMFFVFQLDIQHFFLIKTSAILFITSIFFLNLKKVLLRFTPCASKAKVRTPCLKQKPQEIIHCHTRFFKIVCYKCSKIP